MTFEIGTPGSRLRTFFDSRSPHIVQSPFWADAKDISKCPYLNLGPSINMVETYAKEIKDEIALFDHDKNNRVINAEDIATTVTIIRNYLPDATSPNHPLYKLWGSLVCDIPHAFLYKPGNPHRERYIQALSTFDELLSEFLKTGEWSKEDTEEVELERAYRNLKDLNDNKITPDKVKLLVSHMQGGNFYISDSLYSGVSLPSGLYYLEGIAHHRSKRIQVQDSLKDCINLTPFDIERRGFDCQQKYSKNKLGNSIVFEWLDNFGPGHVSVLSPTQMVFLIGKMLKANPKVAYVFYSEMMHQAFYGNGEAKSY